MWSLFEWAILHLDQVINIGLYFITTSCMHIGPVSAPFNWWKDDI